VIATTTIKQKEVPMKHITFENQELVGVVFDVGALVEQLHTLTDSRQARGKRYPLPFLLVVVLMAKICGQNKPTGMAEWVRLRREQLVLAFELGRETVPSLNTIRRTVAETVSAEELHGLFRRFLHQEYGGQQSVIISLDGKTLRGTIPKGKTQGVHLLAAYLPEEGIVLMQVAVANKENEIRAAPRVLKRLDLREKIVCGDAMFTQRGLSVQINAQGGDFIWFVKDNQPQLRVDVEQFFVPPRKAKGWAIAQLPQETAQVTQKAHGRIETRKLTLMQDETGFIDWPCLEQVFKLERQVVHCNTGELSAETVYGITSLSRTRASAAELLEWTQAYWGIENGLHYRRDKTLQEDETRMANVNQAQVIATLNNFIIGLATKLGFKNLASAQRHFDAEINKLLLTNG
jgi:predicted transposase YbfD/YdcC